MVIEYGNCMDMDMEMAIIFNGSGHGNGHGKLHYLLIPWAWFRFMIHGRLIWIGL